MAIVISKPQAGRQAVIQARADETIELNFTPDQAFPERVGDDLVFRFEDGSTSTVSGFFTDLTRENLPDFVLPDETVLTGEDFFTAINPDLLPAAGGSTGGSGAYDDNAGALVDGLDAMDPLNPNFWDNGVELPPMANGLDDFAAVAAPVAPPTLIITPVVPDPDPELDYEISAEGVSFTMDEAHLEDGSEHGDGPTTTQVALAVTGTDVPAVLVIEGVQYAINPDGSLADFPADGILDADGDGAGRLTNPSVTAQPDGSYLVTFDYTLENNHLHDAGADREDNLDSFDVAVIGEGGAESGTVSIDVNLIDDEPEISFTGMDGNLDSGAVRTGEIAYEGGADGAKSVVIDGFDLLSLKDGESHTFTGKGGTLTVTMGADGALSYEYKALANGELDGDVADSFKVIITDGDNDVADDTLSFDVTPVTVPDGVAIEHLVVDDSALDEANAPHAGTAGASDTVKIELDGWETVAKEYSSDWGTLVVDADGNATFKLERAYTHGSDDNDHDALADGVHTFTIDVKDGNGNTGSVEITLDIYDDGPNIKFVAKEDNTDDDVYNLDSGAVRTGEIAYEGGADGAKSVVIDDFNLLSLADGESHTFTGKGGTLTVTMGADGALSYEYKALANGELDGDVADSFKVIITDGDNDVADDTLSFDVTDITAPNNGETIEELSVDDSALYGGADTAFIGSTDIAGGLNAQLGGTWKLVDDVLPLTDPEGNVVGRLEISSDGTAKVVLEKAYSHDGTNGTDDSWNDQVFDVKVQDANGNTGTVQITVNVNDDGPKAVVDTNTLDYTQNYVDGNVLDNDKFGADGEAEAADKIDWTNADGKVSITIDGKPLTLDENGQLSDGQGNAYGKLSLNEDGSYIYKRPENAVSGDLKVEYTIEDSDGSRSSSSLTITVDNGVVVDMPTSGDGALSVSEAYLEANLEVGGKQAHGGTNAGTPDDTTDSGFFIVTAPDGLGSLSIDDQLVYKDGVIQNNPIVGDYGQMTIDGVKDNGDGTYTVEYSYTLEQRAEHADGDGRNTDIVDARGDESFAVVVTDKDGDSKEATINVAIADDAPKAGDDSAIVSEVFIRKDEDSSDRLETGSFNYNGATKDEDLSDNGVTDTATGKIELDYGADGPATKDAFTWNTESCPSLEAMVDGSWETVTWVDEGGGKLVGHAGGEYDELTGKYVGGESVITVKMGTTTGEYEVNITTGFRHDDPDGKDSFDYNQDFGANDQLSGTDLNLGYTLKDADGDTADGTLTVTIQDDVLDVPASEGTLEWTKGDEDPGQGWFENSDKIDLTYKSGKPENEKITFGDNDVNTRDGVTISAGEVTLTRKGESDSYDLTFKDASDSGKIYQQGNGLGVRDADVEALGRDEKGNENQDAPRYDEINFQGTIEGGTAEAVIIDLDGRAFGVHLDMGDFYADLGGEEEKGAMYFYRKIADGEYELVGSHNFSSKDSSGNATTERIMDLDQFGGFDRVVIVAKPDPNLNKTEQSDNSDFYIKGIQFDTAKDVVEHYESGAIGTATGTGADGLKEGSFQITLDGSSTIKTSSGMITMELTDDGILVGTLNGETAFVLTLTASGKWEYVQYQKFDVLDEDGNPTADINFGFRVQDNDGDWTNSTILVDSGKTPDQVPGDLKLENLQVHEDGLAGIGTNAGEHPVADASGRVTIEAADGLATITINGVVIALNADGSVPAFEYPFAAGNVEHGVLEVTGITRDGDNYQVTYSYTLTEAADHPAGEGDHQGLGDDGVLEIAVGATDLDGDTTPDASFTIDILDDNPLDIAVDANIINGNSSVTKDLVDFGADRYGNMQLETADGLAEGSVIFTVSDEPLWFCAENGERVNFETQPDGSITGKAGDLTVCTITANAENGTYTYDQHYEVHGGRETSVIWDETTGIESPSKGDGVWSITEEGILTGQQDNNDPIIIYAETDGQRAYINGSRHMGLETGNAGFTNNDELFFSFNKEMSGFKLDYRAIGGTVGNDDSFAYVIHYTLNGQDFSYPENGYADYPLGNKGSFELHFDEFLPDGAEVTDIQVKPDFSSDSDEVVFTGVGMVSYTEDTTYPPADLEVEFVATDGDGDRVSGDITLSPLESMNSADGPNGSILDFSGDDRSHILNGGAHDDVIYGGANNDLIQGNAGSDTIYGNAGSDTIYGNAGNDILIGGDGDDILVGGGGGDIFHFDKLAAADSDQHDEIRDFQLNDDTVQFADLFGDNDANSLDKLVDSAEFADNTLSVSHNGQTLEAEFKDNSVELTVNNGDAQQNITVVFDNAADYSMPADADAAMQIIQSMIKEGAI